nr:ATP-dependent 6-phosphofructokinase 4, chloroplastic [Tanacetum cinerariifolium]
MNLLRTEGQSKVGGNCMCMAAFLAIQAPALARCPASFFVSPKDILAQQIVIQKGSPRGVHFRRAGPEKVLIIYLASREGIRAFYSRNTMEQTPKNVNDIHKRGGTILQTSRGGHDANKIVDNIPDHGINQEGEKCHFRVAVAGIPKIIDNDIAISFLNCFYSFIILEINNTELLQVIEKLFGFDTAVEEAQSLRGIHRYVCHSGESRCESPFYLEGECGLYEYVQQRLKENKHVVIVLAEGAGQEYVSESANAYVEKDASENKLLLDIGLWLTQKMMPNTHHILATVGIFAHLKSNKTLTRTTTTTATLPESPSKSLPARSSTTVAANYRRLAGYSSDLAIETSISQEICLFEIAIAAAAVSPETSPPVYSIFFRLKKNQEKDKIGSKPDKNGKHGEAEKSQKQLQ